MVERLWLTIALLFFLLAYTYIMSRRLGWTPARDPVVASVLTLLAALWGVGIG